MPRAGQFDHTFAASHHHSFWVGTGEERKLDLRWMPPIPVKMDFASKPTIRNVGENSR